MRTIRRMNFACRRVPRGRFGSGCARERSISPSLGGRSVLGGRKKKTVQFRPSLRTAARGACDRPVVVVTLRPEVQKPMYVDLNGRMTPEQARQVVEALNARHVNHPCPRCGNAHFTLLEGYFNQPFSGEAPYASGAMAFSRGPTVPSVVTACTNCGFLSQHALGVLGLLPPQPPQHPLERPRGYYSEVGEPTKIVG
jgi:ribosomal protein S27AE